MKYWKWYSSEQEWRSGADAVSADGVRVGGWELGREKTDELLTLLQRRKDGHFAPEPTLKQVCKWLEANHWRCLGETGFTQYWGPAHTPARVAFNPFWSVTTLVQAISLIVGRNVESEVLACSE